MRNIHPQYVAKPCSPFRHKNVENAVSSLCLWLSSFILVLSNPFACIGQNIFSGDFNFQETVYIDDFLRKSLCFTNIYDNATDLILYSIIRQDKYITYKRINQGQALPLHLTTETDQISNSFVS